MTGTAHPNVVRLHEAFEAFGKGDLDRLQELWRPDIRWHEPGQNRLSGDYTGIDEVFELFGRVFVLSGGTFRVDLQAASADDTDGVAIVRVTASRGDRELDVLAADLVRFEDGLVAEFWQAHTDQGAMDAFFS
ncbi:nuclear transport factor 2 family protein [Geodermatophilus sp. SYSU D01180]